MQTEQTCRVCLSGSDELTPLRVRLPGKNKTFEETINFVVNIHIVLEHGLPDKICKECGTMLDVADTFKQRCLESEAVLGLLDKGGGTDESPPKFEENDRVIGEKCSEDTYIVPTVISSASLSDSLVAKVKNEDSVPEPKIKIEIVEEECIDDETKTEQDDKQEFEAPLTKVKDELLVKEEALEIPLNDNDEDFLLKPMQHLEMLHHSCNDCGKDFPSRGSLELHRKDGPCPTKLYPDDIKPSTSVLTAALDQEATHHCAEGSRAARSAHGTRGRRRGRPPKLGDRQNDTKTGSKTRARQNDTKTGSKTRARQNDTKTGSKTRARQNDTKTGSKTKKKLEARTNKRRFICNECGRVYIRKHNLEGHMKIHTFGGKPYSCKVCEKKFKKKSQLENHSRTHTGLRPFSCSFCGKTFSQKAHLDSHEKTLHLDYRSHACDVCDKKFPTKRKVEIHYVMHTGEKPYSCHICEKRFTQKNRLDIHIRMHTGERPFPCHICEKKFIEKRHLDNHIKIHTGEKPHSCNICEKRFIQKIHLDGHIRTHTGEKPYSCNLCEKTYRESSNLSRHLRRKHSETKPFSCDACLKKFYDSPALKRHSCKMRRAVNTETTDTEVIIGK